MNNINPHSPTISLITVCRNSAATIAKTIESVLAQKDSGVEYVIVDGASTDGTQDIIRSYQAIDRFVSESDRGIADAFNKGIGMATGDIIGLINSDDQLCPSTLATVRRYFSEHHDVDVLHGDVLLFDGNTVVKRLKPSGRWWYPWRLVLFNHPATFVRREVYREHGLFDANYRIAMDVEIFLRWMTQGVTIRYLPGVLAHMQSGGTSGQQALDGFREVRRAALKHGFHPFGAHLQFAGKVFVWWVLEILVWIKQRSASAKASL
jgi:glycosyltransferase involved in cell wall biosynthesis